MKKSISIIILLVLGIILSSCGRVNKVQDGSEKESYIEKEEKTSTKKDELKIPLTRITSLDPLENDNYSYYNFSKLIYQPLFEFDRNLKPVALLAEAYKVKNGGRTLEIQLKEDIYWHNGDRLTSKDVEFTIERLKTMDDKGIYGKNLGSALGSFTNLNMKNIIETQIIDEKTIDIHFNRVYGNSLEALTFPIVHRDSYISEDRYEPMGTGPYIYKDYKASQGITLEKNEKYWNGKVNISKIYGKIYENENSILNAFEDGRVDFAYSTNINLDRYEKDPNIRVLEYISPEYEFLGYNFKNELLSGKDGKAIRKAIYYAIDRQEIIRKVYEGNATQVDTPIYPESYLAEDVSKFYGHNIIRSKEILGASGFEELGKDGFLRDKSGRKLSFELVTNYSNSLRRQTAEIIKKNLEEVGIEILLKYPYKDIESSNSQSVDKEWKRLNGFLKNGEYDLSVLGWEISEVNDLSFMFHSSFIPSGSNIVFYKNKDMDKLLEDVYFSKIEDKEEKYIYLQEKIMEELPYGSLFFRNKAILLNASISGEFNPTFLNLYRGIENYQFLEDNY